MAILALDPQSGTHTNVTTLELARTQATYANKTIVVTSALTQAQSNITAAWPADRALKFQKGGSIANSTAFTINGPFSAGDYQVFTGSGALTGLKEVRPEWFGDATTAAAMSGAIACLKASGGGTYRMSKGTYAPIVADFGNLVIEGEGQGVSVVLVTSWVDGVRVSPPGYPGVTYNIRNVTLRNFTVNGNRAGYANGANDTYGNGVNINGVDNYLVENVEVYDQAEQGIVSTYWEGTTTPTEYQTKGTIRNCLVRNTITLKIAIGAEGHSANALIDGNTVQNGGNIYTGNGGDTTIRPRNIRISNNNVLGLVPQNAIGIRVDGAGEDIFVVDNLVDNYSIGIRYGTNDSTGTFEIDGLLIDRNTITKFVEYGILAFPMAPLNLKPRINITRNKLASTIALVGYANAAIFVQQGATVSGNELITNGIGILARNSNVIARNTVESGDVSIYMDSSNSLPNYVLDNKINGSVYTVSAFDKLSGNYGGDPNSITTNQSTMANFTIDYGTAPPTTGFHIQGSLRYNVQFTVFGAPGSYYYIDYWRCTESGTPGTWYPQKLLNGL